MKNIRQNIIANRLIPVENMDPHLLGEFFPWPTGLFWPNPDALKMKRSNLFSPMKTDRVRKKILLHIKFNRFSTGI